MGRATEGSFAKGASTHTTASADDDACPPPPQPPKTAIVTNAIPRATYPVVRDMTSKLTTFAIATASAVVLAAGPAFAGAGNPSGTGQPNQSCETTGSRPGNASGASGSAFNEEGTAGTQYAGEQTQNSKNTHSVSQYDVACAKQPA